MTALPFSSRAVTRKMKPLLEKDFPKLVLTWLLLLSFRSQFVLRQDQQKRNRSTWSCSRFSERKLESGSWTGTSNSPFLGSIPKTPHNKPEKYK